MTSLIKALVVWLIEKWLKDYHLSKNPPKGRKKKEADDAIRAEAET